MEAGTTIGRGHAAQMDSDHQSLLRGIATGLAVVIPLDAALIAIVWLLT